MIVFDASGTIIDVNPSYEKMSRFTMQELIGKNGADIVRKMVNPADIDKVFSGFNNAISE